MALTITEALAEIKTIGKRLIAKRAFIAQNLARMDGLKDPLEKDGGSVDVIERERQAITDLETRIVALRRGIQRANTETPITIDGTVKTIADWLTWRRDVAPETKKFLMGIQGSIQQIRQQARTKGQNIVGSGSEATAPSDIIMNLNEGDLAHDIEEMENILGQLDGQLSLKNATVIIQE